MCRNMASQKSTLNPLREKRRARRNLFGPVDRDQLRVEYQAALGRELDEVSKRWGFDFRSDKPIESGNFEWEGIPEASVPLLYRSCVLAVGQAKGLRMAEAPLVRGTKGSRMQKENIPQTPEKCAPELEALERTPDKGDHAGLKRKQTNITDFYQAKRRVVWMPRKSGE